MNQLMLVEQIMLILIVLSGVATVVAGVFTYVSVKRRSALHTEPKTTDSHIIVKMKGETTTNDMVDAKRHKGTREHPDTS
jgi:heme/copper-type cytochrome/quinol oxidase subunit 2